MRVEIRKDKSIALILRGKVGAILQLYPLNKVELAKEYRGRGYKKDCLRIKKEYSQISSYQKDEIQAFRMLYNEWEKLPPNNVLFQALEYLITERKNYNREVYSWIDFFLHFPSCLETIKFDRKAIENFSVYTYCSPETYCRNYRFYNEAKEQGFFNNGIYDKIMSAETFVEYHDEKYFKKAINLFNKDIESRKKITEEIKKLEESIAKMNGNPLIEVTIKQKRDWAARKGFNSVVSYFQIFEDLQQTYDRYNELSTIQKFEMIPKQFKSLEEVYRETSRIKNLSIALEEKEQDKKFKEFQLLKLKPFEDERYQIIIPQSYKECAEYGEIMHNCLGGYEWNQYLKTLERRVFLVKDNNENDIVACIDLDFRLKIMQALKKYNEKITEPELITFIEQYVKYIKEA